MVIPFKATLQQQPLQGKVPKPLNSRGRGGSGVSYLTPATAAPTLEKETKRVNGRETIVSYMKELL